ncbi:Ig-like domain-containing protein [Porphyromonadaceae bacterium W3.11]|nr:Ig-like domain-containing protein [Porphyromonadaceae bacterium W3.11]
MIGVFALNACSSKDKDKPVEITKIKLDQEKYELTVGESVTLKATLTPANSKETIAWSSDKTSVATVEDGVVSAKGEGKATITAKLSNGNKATCIVTVKAPKEPEEPDQPEVEGTKISLNKEHHSLKVGESFTLKAELTPADAKDKITWSCTPDKIVSVENGEVKALSAGEAKVTAKLENGNSASCTVTVEANEEDDEDEDTPNLTIKFKQDTYTIKVGQTLDLKNEVVQPEGENFKFDLETVDDCIKIEGTVVTGVSEGEGYVDLYAPKADLSASCTIIVSNDASDNGNEDNGESDEDDNNGEEDTPKSVTIDPSKVTLLEGETTQLTINYNGIDKSTVELKSTNESVAKVTNEGKITAVAAGSAQIKIVVDGTVQHNSCMVIVNKKVEQGQYSYVIRHVKRDTGSNDDIISDNRVGEDKTIHDQFLKYKSAAKNRCYIYLTITDNNTKEVVEKDFARQWEIESIDESSKVFSSGWTGDINWWGPGQCKVRLKSDKYGIDDVITLIVE